MAQIQSQKRGLGFGGGLMIYMSFIMSHSGPCFCCASSYLRSFFLTWKVEMVAWEYLLPTSCTYRLPCKLNEIVTHLTVNPLSGTYQGVTAY